jgi:hypothetical protein
LKQPCQLGFSPGLDRQRSQLSILIAHKNVRSRQLEADLPASSPTP